MLYELGQEKYDIPEKVYNHIKNLEEQLAAKLCEKRQNKMAIPDDAYTTFGQDR